MRQLWANNIDPLAKQTIKNELENFLYLPVKKSLERQISVLIVRNTLLNKCLYKAFYYKEKYYTLEIGPPPLKRNMLNPQLKPEMDTYLKEKKHLEETEIPYVLGFITQVLNSSNNFADYFKIFPEALHRTIHNIRLSYVTNSKQLTDEEINNLLQRNKVAIDLLKARLVTNLLI